MNYYLGFDGGGTKTACALVDGAGKELAQEFDGPSNPLRSSFEEAFAALQAVAERTLAAAGAPAADVRGVCVGLAGAGRASVARAAEEFLQRAFPRASVSVTTDLELALEAAAGSGPGVVLVAGTGSACYGRNSRGERARAGGWGAWIGDEGSGTDIGRRALAAAAREHDALGPPTHLEEKILSGLDCGEWEALIELVGQDALKVLPRIFPLVAQAEREGNETAKAILSGAAEALSDIAGSVVKRLGLGDEEFVLAKVGGVFDGSPYLDEAVTESLHLIAPHARIERPQTPPAVAAARLAARRAQT